MVDNFFYPHKLYLKVGDNFVFQKECQDQPNKGNGTITTPDRVNYIFKSLIFIPNDQVLRFKPGQEIQVVGNNGEVRITGTVARFAFDDQSLDVNRLWI